MYSRRNKQQNQINVQDILKKKNISESDSNSGYEENSDDNSFIEGTPYEDDYQDKPKAQKKELEKGQKSLADFASPSKNKSITKQISPKVDNIDSNEILNILENVINNKKLKKEKKTRRKKSVADGPDFVNDNLPKNEKSAPLIIKKEFEIEKNILSKTQEPEKIVSFEKPKELPIIQTQILEEIPKKNSLEIQKVDFNASLEFIDASEVENKIKPNINSDGTLNIYLFHIHEEKGSLFLFGKNKNQNNSYTTVCIRIKNPKYFLYFHPKDDMIESLQKEVEKIAKVCGGICLSQNIERKIYVFQDDNIPKISNWICAEFSHNCDLEKVSNEGISYHKVIGLTSNLIECFLVKKKLWGPRWITISNFEEVTQTFSLCPTYDINTFDDIDILSKQLPLPSFNLASISVRTAFNNSKKIHEIFMISLKIFNNLDIEKFETMYKQKKLETSMTFICSPTFSNLSTEFVHDKKVLEDKSLIICKNERELLHQFVSKIELFDIDLLSSYGLTTFEGPLIAQRIFDLKVEHGFKYGRIKRNQIGKLFKPNTLFSLSGRLPVDLRISASEFLRSKTNDFSSIVQQELKKDRQMIDHFDIISEITDKTKLQNLINYNIRDTDFIELLMKKIQVLPLTLQISNLSACPWSRVLLGMASYRSESLLTHNFNDRNYIVPDKVQLNNHSFKREDAKYAGGLVLSPKRGFYENCILLLDFNSLYPSIIREYNLCFSTVDRENPDAFVSQKKKDEGILPSIMKNLLDERSKVRQSLKNEKNEIEQQRLNIKQLAIKILANSMYGYLGFKGSRFPATEIASLITERGRAILEDTVQKVEGMGSYSIIYGDTDSIMINSNLNNVDEAFNAASKISNEISKHYKYLRLGIDGIFLKMLLVSKKKYAALLHHNDGPPTQELKGLDMVRRDWCILTKSLSGFVINQFMTEPNRDNAISNILQELERVSFLLRNNGSPPSEDSEIKFQLKDKSLPKISKNHLIISKALKRPVDEYPKINTPPHVIVAKKMIERGENVPINATIGYIVTNPSEKLMEHKVKHPDEVFDIQSSDIEWYIRNQILNPIWRLCEPFGGVEINMLNKALGLIINTSLSFDYDDSNSMINQILAIPRLVELQYHCQNCKETIFIKPVLKGCLNCISCGFEHQWKPVSNILIEFIKEFLYNHQLTYYNCNGHLCDYETIQLPVSTLYPRHNNSFAEGRSCKGKIKQKYSSIDIFNTLRYFKALFSLNECDPLLIDFKNYMNSKCHNFIDLHGFSHIKMINLFSSIHKKK